MENVQLAFIFALVTAVFTASFQVLVRKGREYGNALTGALIGIFVGLTGIAKPEGNLDLAGRIFGIGTYALPPFWVAMCVQLVFAVLLGWLPVGGRFPPSLLPPSGSGFLLLDSIISKDWLSLNGAIRHLILPASTLGILLSGIFSRALRINLNRTLQADHIEAARSRG